MKDKVNHIIPVAIISIAVVALFAIFAEQLSEKELPDINILQNGENIEKLHNDLSIQGSAAVYVNPDLAILDFEVETYDKAIDVAQKNNSDLMQKVIQNLKDLGVEDKNLQTSDYYVDTHYDNEYPSKWWEIGGVPEVEYFMVRNRLTVRVEKLDTIQEILNKAVEAGATSIGSIQFTMKDFDDSREKAYKKAAEMVKKRAKYISDSMGVELGQILNITPTHQAIDYYWAPRNAMANQMVSYDGGGNYEGGGVSAGQVEVKVTISARYEIFQ